MLLGKLLKSVNNKYKKIPINGISFDSRKVQKKDIFFAIKGNNTSGTKFIREAIAKGASAVISSKKAKDRNLTIPFIRTKDVRKSLSEACSNYYKNNKNINIIAVTGTNGKSSIVNFFYQILNFNNISVASIGTLGIISQNYKKKTNLTSIDPILLHKTLDIFKKKKIKNIILEASSHGLEQKRLDNLSIKIGIFTNLSVDHLDYHKNMKKYLNSKLYLFKNLLNKNSKIITDEDNKEFTKIKQIAKKKKIKKVTLGTKSGNIKILKNKFIEDNQHVKILFNSKVYNFTIPLIGYFQIKNLLMAILAALICGVKKNAIFKQLHKIKPVPGRLECIANLENNSKIIIDFAHSPDALEKSLMALKNQFKKKIIIVFGCGGERDKKKRYIMGKIASKHCKKVFVTDDNPRNENPKKIRKDIIKGCKKNYVNIESREQAIKTAIHELKSNEILLVAGKGHESTQDYGKKVFKFSDKKIINKLIKKEKFLLKKNIYNNIFQNINFNNVSINTRTIKRNDIFFAIRGKKTDGHNFLSKALHKGAIKLVVNKKIRGIPKNKIIKVKNTLTSLKDLAKINRDNSKAKIIGVTGSVGKTTLKNLLGFSLKNFGKVYHSPYSYNNKFGVPYSLSNLKEDIDYGVFEIGMDKKGEINNLSKIVKPEIGIITSISAAHFKNFKTLKDIARAKSEIIHNIQKGGKLILNKNGKFFTFLSKIAKKNKIEVISFSRKKKADIYLVKIIKIKNNFKLKINIKNKIFYFYTKNSTENYLDNILACISTIFVLNLNLYKIEKKFINFKIPEGRGDVNIVKKFNKKFKFIDESYNANPSSMISAINNINYYKINKNSHKYVFLGDMLELGTKSKKFHKDLSIVLNKSNIDRVFVHGKYIKETFNNLSTNKKGKIFKTIKDANYYFSKNLHNNDILMVKGSNATGLSHFSQNIKRENSNAI